MWGRRNTLFKGVPEAPVAPNVAKYPPWRIPLKAGEKIFCGTRVAKPFEEKNLSTRKNPPLKSNPIAPFWELTPSREEIGRKVSHG